jgi:hypothetical protein
VIALAITVIALAAVAGVGLMGYGLYAWLTTSHFDVMSDREAELALRTQHEVKRTPQNPPVNGYHDGRIYVVSDDEPVA